MREELEKQDKSELKMVSLLPILGTLVREGGNGMEEALARIRDIRGRISFAGCWVLTVTDARTPLSSVCLYSYRIKIWVEYELKLATCWAVLLFVQLRGSSCSKSVAEQCFFHIAGVLQPSHSLPTQAGPCTLRGSRLSLPQALQCWTFSRSCCEQHRSRVHHLRLK